MNAELDPYRAPTARRLERSSAGRMRIDGKALVIPREFTLPPFCVVTGEPLASTPATRRTKKLQWSPQWILLLVLVNLLIAAIVQYAMRKLGRVEYLISPAAAAEYRKRWWITWGVLVGGFVVMFVGPNVDMPWLIAVGLLAILTSFVLMLSWCRLLWAQKMDETTMHLRGVRIEAMRAMLRHAEDEEAARGPEGDWRNAMFPPQAGRVEPTLR